MNRFFLTIMLLFLFSITSFSQVELRETDKLVQLAKVWGFLKYYHPQVAKGKFDWDKELIQLLPQLEKVSTKEEISALFNNWIKSLGKVKKCRKCDKLPTDYFDKNHDLTWISDSSIFNNELTERLIEIESKRHLGKKHYVTYAKKNPSEAKMINEKIFDKDTWSNSNIRLITLFRYWNFVEYFFPYKYQTDKPWNDVLEYFIPIFLNAKTETAFHLALLELVVSIDDSHGVFNTDKTIEFFGDKFLPATVKYIDGVGVVTGFYNDSLAALDDLKLGDIITKVEFTDVAAIYNSNEKYISGSNESRKKLLASIYLFNGGTDTINIHFERDGELYSKKVRRYLYKDLNYKRKTKPIYEVLDDNIGYINMGLLDREDVTPVFDELISTDGLILDFRNRPNNTWDLIIDYISSNEKEFCRIIYPVLDYPGKYIVYEPLKCGSNSPKKYAAKIVLLVNENTQSHSEYSVMCLQTGDNVITVGSTTSGADGNTTSFELFSNYKTMITGTGVFYPDMSETQRKGIKIDHKVEPTVKGVSENKDELLLKAIKVLTG